MPRIRARTAQRFGALVDQAIVLGDPDRREPNWFDGIYADPEKIARELAGGLIADVTPRAVAGTSRRSYGLGHSIPWSKDKWHPARSQISR